MNFSKMAQGAFFAFPLLLFIVLGIYFWVDVPFRDDIGAVLKSLNEFGDATNWSDALRALTQQHDERRIIVSRLFALLSYNLTGTVNFYYLRLVGIGVLVGIAWLTWRVGKHTSAPVITLLPLSYLIFQQQYYEGFFYAIVPTQYFMVIALAMLTFYWLFWGNQSHSYLALLCGAMALASDTVGIFVLAIAGVVLLVRRQVYMFLVWSGCSVLLGFLYFHRFNIPAYRPSVLPNLIDYPHLVLADFLAMLGGFFDPGDDFPLVLRGCCTIGLGLPIALYWVWKTWRVLDSWKNHQTFPSRVFGFNICVMIFLSLTAAAFAVARASEGFEAVLLSRYKLTSTLVLVITYLSVVEESAPQHYPKLGYLMLLVALAVWAHSYFYHTVRIANHRKDLLADAYSWPNLRLIPSSPVYLSMRTLVDSVLVQSQANGLYRFPQLITLSTINTPPQAPKSSLIIQSTPQVVFVNGNGLDESIWSNRKTFFLSVENPNDQDKPYLFPLYFKRNSPLQSLRKQSYLSDAFEAPILKAYLPKTNYQLSYLVIEGSQVKRYPSGSNLRW